MLRDALPRANRSLRANDVHIWRLSLDLAASSVEKLRELLRPEEQARADRLHSEPERRNFIVARAYVRKILSDYLGLKFTEVGFTYLKHGKPVLPESINPIGLNFNISHSGAFALCAVTLKRRIGVDLECLRPGVSFDEIAPKFFSAGEAFQLKQIPSAVRRRAFFNCWTRKEAFIKALGVGLSLPLDQFEVTLLPSEPAALVRTQWDPTEASRWSLTEVIVKPGYVAAVAVEGHDCRLRAWDIDEWERV